MSGPLKLVAADLERLAQALARMTKMRAELGVDLSPYGRSEISVGGYALKFTWDAEISEYVIDDTVGD